MVLGLSPHQHVADLYRLEPLLAGRAVLFVSRCFYWTDYSLSKWLELGLYGFCSWDAMQDPFSRRMELRRFRSLCVDRKEENGVPNVELSVQNVLFMTQMQILQKFNRWLYRELPAVGLTGYEIKLLGLMTEGHKGHLSARSRSLHKNNGLYKLGMTKHVMCHRGVKVRTELQIGLPS